MKITYQGREYKSLTELQKITKSTSKPAPAMNQRPTGNCFKCKQPRESCCC